MGFEKSVIGCLKALCFLCVIKVQTRERLSFHLNSDIVRWTVSCNDYAMKWIEFSFLVFNKCATQTARCTFCPRLIKRFRCK